MNCSEFRRAFDADPTLASAEVLAHRAACASCEKHAQQILQFDVLIKRALEIPVENSKTVTTAFVAPQISRPWYAMAANVLATSAAVAALVWLAYPRESLASEAVTHMKGELASMTTTDQRVAVNMLDAVLHAYGLHLATPMSDVSYLQSCPFRGGIVPHLVVQTAHGPVTVLILPHEHVTSSKQFTEGPYRGMLAPFGRGGMAVISQDAEVLQSVVAKINSSIAWN